MNTYHPVYSYTQDTPIPAGTALIVLGVVVIVVLCLTLLAARAEREN